MKKTAILFGALCCLAACGTKTDKPALLDASAFSTEVDNKPVALYTLESGNGLYMQVTNLGGRVVSLFAPDKTGKYEDVVLGFNNIDSYLHNPGERYLGPVVGRYANRIARGQFMLDGVTYQLPLNNNGQTLHGGLTGLDMVAWNVDEVTDNEIKMSYVSPDGTDGFPGNLTVRMTYTLTPQNEFKIHYEATTDKPTVVNLSHHGLFNLKGEGNGTILDHVVTLNASHITPVDSVLIPTGEIAPVEGTPFDFRTPHAIGERIDADNQQLKNARGYDHLYSFELPIITVKIEGIVFDVDEVPIEGATVRIVGRDGLNAKVLTMKNGEYEVELERDIRYGPHRGARRPQCQGIDDEERGV